MCISLKQIDKNGANPERVMQELSSIGLMPEDWGGDVPMVQVYISYWLEMESLSYFVYASVTYRKLYCAFFLFCQQISALKGENVDDLLETVMLVAEVTCLFLKS